MTNTASGVTEQRSKFAWVLKELPVVIALCIGGLILAHWQPFAAGGATGTFVWMLFLVGCILAASMRAMAHAETLAEHYGEPIGTVILTISAITIEVAAVCALMLGADGEPAIARDMMFAVLMIILNLLIGVIILVGTWRKQEAEFNLQSARNYLAMIVALAMITLVLPRFTRAEAGGFMSDPMEHFVGVTSLLIYLAFLWVQTSSHRDFYEYRAEGSTARVAPAPHPRSANVWRPIVLLILSLVAVVMIAEGLAPNINGLLSDALIPAPIGGVFIAALVLAPEGFTAIRAVRRQDMQRSINVLLGSALATIGLTVPAVLVIRHLTGRDPEFGLEGPYIVLLVATLFVTSFNLNRGRVNVVQGFIHILLFFTWIIVILDEASVST
ncbi:MAG: hypothetical protein EXS10_10090 [Phycisphaerales bacterium]|nr:hypothetical protein [Phycisphaerales bacterium]